MNGEGKKKVNKSPLAEKKNPLNRKTYGFKKESKYLRLDYSRLILEDMRIQLNFMIPLVKLWVVRQKSYKNMN